MYFYNLGETYLKLAKNEEAVEPLETAKSFYPEDVNILSLLRKAYISLTRDKEFVGLSSTKALVKAKMLIKLAYITNNTDEKIEIFEKAIEVFLGLKYRGRTYIECIKLATEALSECDFITPKKKAEIYYDIGVDYLSRKAKIHSKTALEYFELSMKLNNLFFDAYEKAIITCGKINYSGAAKKKRRQAKIF